MDMKRHMLLSFSCFKKECIEIINILSNNFLNHTHTLMGHLKPLNIVREETLDSSKVI
jgi:hypothetical protein